MSTEIITRRRLPHWYVPGAAHFVTYRLADTLPAAVRAELNARRDRLLEQPLPEGISISEHRLRVHKQLFAAYDDYLDRNCDVRWLEEPRVAAVVRSNLYHHDGAKYDLLAYCIMPTHVHVLLRPTPEEITHWQHTLQRRARCQRAADGSSEFLDESEQPPVGEQPDKLSPLARIMHSLKSYTANEANKILKREGRFWQKESYDHWVRDDDELERIVNYIRANPVKAGLRDRHEDWFWCSCHDRFLLDGDTSAWLPVGHAASVPPCSVPHDE
jgi:putative DNA methylase